MNELPNIDDSRNILLDEEQEEEYKFFLRSLNWTDGFGLFFVECIPQQATRLVKRLKKDLPEKSIEILKFTEPIDNLYNVVNNLPNRDNINILCIEGLEYSLNKYIKSGFGGEGDYYKEDSVPRILEHLNLQRERFRDSFNICLIFLLPRYAIKYFIRRAPDFYDWRSSAFKFSTDKDILEEILQVIDNELKEENLEALTLTQCQNNLARIDGVIDDVIKESHQNQHRQADLADLFLKKGLLLSRLKRYQDAINNYDRVLRINDKLSKIWFNRGLTLIVLQRSEEAILNFDNALELETNEDRKFNVFVNRGLALLILGRLEETVNSFDNALKIKANDDELWADRGRILSNLERYEEALISFDKALEIKFDDYKIWADKGRILFNLKRYQNSLESFNIALEIEPNDKQILAERGKILNILNSPKTLEENLMMANPKPRKRNSILRQIYLTGIGIGTIIALIFGFGVARDIGKNSCPLPNQTKQFDICIEPDRFSSGEYNILKTITNSKRDLGIKAFKQRQYDEAIELFNQAIKDNPKDPESQIYLNNSQALKKGNPFVFAVVVPVILKNGETAQYMLQGVADAQTNFNANGGLNDRLLQIKIGNDDDDPEIAKNIAHILAQDKKILGIIGHYRSTVSKKALEEYSSKKLVMVSPTSSASNLKSEIFFRVIASNKKYGEKLADYANKEKLKNIAIFYNPDDNYSENIKKEFQGHFENQAQYKVKSNYLVSDLNAEKEVHNLIGKTDVIFLAPDTKLILKAIEIVTANNQLHPKQQMQLLAGSGMYSCDTLEQGRSALEGLVLVIPWFRSDSDYTHKTEKRWKTKYLHWAIAMSYDATQTLIKALSADATRDSILKKLHDKNFSLSPRETSGKEIKFVNGEGQLKPILVQVVKGNQEGCPSKTEVMFKSLNK